MCTHMKVFTYICIQRSCCANVLFVTFCLQGFEMIITQSFAKNMGM